MSQIIQVKNVDIVNHTYQGTILAPNEVKQLTEIEKPKWSEDAQLLTDVSNGLAQIGDGAQFFTDVNEQINWLKGNATIPVKSVESPPFAAKILPDGRKLYRRKHGFSGTVDANSTANIDFIIPYNTAKLNELEVMNPSEGDSVDLEVYDTPTGTISGYPNVKLNQFGFGVYMPNALYRDRSNYDADVIKDMKVRVVYTNNTASSKTIYFNITLHEIV